METSGEHPELHETTPSQSRQPSLAKFMEEILKDQAIVNAGLEAMLNRLHPLILERLGSFSRQAYEGTVAGHLWGSRIQISTGGKLMLTIPLGASEDTDDAIALLRVVQRLIPRQEAWISRELLGAKKEALFVCLSLTPELLGSLEAPPKPAIGDAQVSTRDGFTGSVFRL